MQRKCFIENTILNFILIKQSGIFSWIYFAGMFLSTSHSCRFPEYTGPVLEKDMSKNTREHETLQVHHETKQAENETAYVNTSTIRGNTITIRQNTSTRQSNTGTKEA